MNKIFNAFLILTLFLFSFGQLGRISIPGRPIFFYIYELFLTTSVAHLFLKYRTLPLFKSGWQRYSLIFILWTLTSLVFSVNSYNVQENVIAVLYLIRLIVYFLFGIYFSYHLSNSKNFNFNKVIFSFIIWVIFTSIIQYFLYPNIGNLAYLGWDPHIYRLVGLYFEPPIAASILFIISWYLYASEDFKYLNRFFKYILITISLALIILTFSRGAYLAIIAVIIFTLISMKKYRIIIALFVVIVTIIIFLPRSNIESTDIFRTTSVYSRIDDYSKGLQIWKRHPIIGIGYNHLRSQKSALDDEIYVEDYNPSHGISSFHSSFLIILATTGLIGLTIFLLFIHKIYSLSFLTRGLIIFISTISILDNVLLHPIILLTLFLIISREVSSQAQT